MACNLTDTNVPVSGMPIIPYFYNVFYFIIALAEGWDLFRLPCYRAFGPCYGLLGEVGGGINKSKFVIKLLLWIYYVHGTKTNRFIEMSQPTRPPPQRI